MTPEITIPFNRPWLTGNEVNYILEAMAAGHVSAGLLQKPGARRGDRDLLLSGAAADPFEICLCLGEPRTGKLKVRLLHCILKLHEYVAGGDLATFGDRQFGDDRIRSCGEYHAFAHQDTEGDLRVAPVTGLQQHRQNERRERHCLEYRDHAGRASCSNSTLSMIIPGDRLVFH